MRLHVLPDVVDVAGNVRAEGLGGFELGKLTTAQLTKWVRAMMSKPVRKDSMVTLAAASVDQAYRTLHLSLQAAVSSGLLGRNPLDGVKKPKVEALPMRFLDEREVGRLVTAMDERYCALVLVGCLCGLRSGELLALRWENVNMLGRKIQVTEQVGEGPSGERVITAPKTTAGRRGVSLPRAVVDALAVHAARSGSQPARGLVFIAANGGALNAKNFRSRYWVPAVKAAGLEPLRVHDMRHTAASLAIKAGADVKVIQRMLGHASAAMTLDRYGHLMPGQAEAVADRLDLLMAAAN